jgi:ABC-2 type transport system ATP-binding protein
VFSTHILSDVERICDRVAILDKGKIVLESALSDLQLKRRAKSVTLEYAEEIDTEALMTVLRTNGFEPAGYEIGADGAGRVESLFLEVAK